MSSSATQHTMAPNGSPPRRFYRLTGWLNVLIWRAPLPRRVAARLSYTVHRNPPMRGQTVLLILDALQQAGVRCWINGGWGVDALVGERTRVHRDLDLLVEDQHLERAVEALAQLGYWEWYRADSEVPMFSRVVLHDHETAGRAVDLHPLELAGTQVEFTSGEIEGRSVPCISATLQIKTHSSYRRRRRDRADVALLRRLREGPVTALIVPVTAAAPLLEKSVREPGLPPHIAILHPFLDVRAIDAETDAVLGAILAELPAFDFELSEIDCLPGVVGAAPEPRDPFIALTRALVERWPEHRPYGGAVEEVVPHLTVAHGGRIPVGLAGRLPVRARAEEVWLMSRVAGRWSRSRAYPLGAAIGAPELERAGAEPH